MIVKELRFENYRNLENNKITPSEKVNVIYGENAQGKTNLLEAIWLFCGGHSFRGSKENEMIAFDKKFFRLGMEFFSGERDQARSERPQTVHRRRDLSASGALCVDPVKISADYQSAKRAFEGYQKAQRAEGYLGDLG